MYMAKLKTKQKVMLIVFAGVIVTMLMLALFGFFVYLIFFHADYGRVYNHYVTYQDEYYSLEVTVEQIKYDEENGSAHIWIKDPWKDYFFVCPQTCQILADSDFFDVVTEDTVITIYSHPYVAWDGWISPVVGVTVGDKVYVDFETGKQNWLDTLKQWSDEVGFLQTPIKG